MTMKNNRKWSFQPAQCLSSAEEEALCWLKAPFSILFHRHLYTPVMSTNSSQVGVTLLLSL